MFTGFFISKLNTLLLGNKKGYFVGFVFYWLWCFFKPVILIRWKEIKLLYPFKFPVFLPQYLWLLLSLFY